MKKQNRKQTVSRCLRLVGTPISNARFKLMALVPLTLLAAVSTLCATPTVTSLSDGAAGSLRAVIAAAPPSATIDFAISGLYTLTAGPLVIDKNLTIDGPAATLTINGNYASSIFVISANAQVSLSHLVISGGQAVPGSGGGIVNNAFLTVTDCVITNCSASSGAGIYNNLNLLLKRCYLVNNYAASGSGGGIYSAGFLTVDSCAFNDNFSGANGGGIYSGGGGTVNNSTFWNNSSLAKGAIYNTAGLTVLNCTISGNIGIEMGGGGLFLSSAAYIGNTIVAGNFGGDVYGAADSQGHNLIGEPSGSGGWLTTDLMFFDPMLGPLQDNGGSTPTMALLPGSHAIDAGDDGVLSSLSLDQRGRSRQSGSHVDIGAFEVGPTPVVTNNNDDGPGSLRVAVLSAAPTEPVHFAPNVVGSIVLTSGEVVVPKSRTVTGPGAKVLTVSGNNVSRVFHITGGASQISDLGLTNGHAFAGGGGIALEAGTSLVVSNCAVSGCYAQSADLANLGGGAISLINLATLTLVNSTISSNSTPYYGGGLYLFNNATGSLVNCTVSGNRTLDGSGDEVWGGGIFMINGSVLTVTNSTIANNSSGAAGGGVYKGFNGSATFRNSLVAGNTAPGGPDCFGPYVSAGFNLIGNTSGSTGFGATGDQLNKNPQLLPLAYNGGPTMTHALLTTSPAVDAGGPGGLAADQRGKLRPFDFPSVANAPGGNSSDIGAFEVNPPEASIVKSGNNVVISWPSYYVGYTVQSTTDPSLLTGWLPVPGTPALVGDHYTLTVAINLVPTWYRLKAP
jgi:hypothetical protein